MCLVQTVEQAREQCVCGGGGDVGRRPSHSNRGFALDEPVERRSRCILAKVGRPRNAPKLDGVESGFVQLRQHCGLIGINLLERRRRLDAFHVTAAEQRHR